MCIPYRCVTLFAAIQKMQEIMHTDITLSGAFVTQSNIMDQALAEIRASDDTPSNLI